MGPAIVQCDSGALPNAWVPYQLILSTGLALLQGVSGRVCLTLWYCTHFKCGLSPSTGWFRKSLSNTWVYYSSDFKYQTVSSIGNWRECRMNTEVGIRFSRYWAVGGSGCWGWLSSRWAPEPVGWTDIEKNTHVLSPCQNGTTNLRPFSQ
jgi:hypothetical protein